MSINALSSSSKVNLTSDTDTSQGSMFLQCISNPTTPTPSEDLAQKEQPDAVSTSEVQPQSITVKDFFDFMKTAYQVYAHLEGEEEGAEKIDWEELTKLTVLNHVIDQGDRDLLHATSNLHPKMPVSKSSSTIENERLALDKRFSSSELELRGRNRRRSLPTEARVEMLGIWTETNLMCKLNDVMNEGILDSILPYLAGYKKPTRTTSDYVPIIKKGSMAEVTKPDSFAGFVHEKETRDRVGRRKSSIVAAQNKINQKHEGDVEIHVCDEVKGLKQDFRCPQKLLVSKMGYFADVTAGQRLEDMDISVHCDIQIFDWLMRWVKKDTILIADWPLLEPGNVIPILVSASFLQMEPLLQDCMIYCHAHLNDIVKTTTNLACLSDALLSRLAAMYTNVELEAIKDRKDKIHTRLYCKMILSLAEPVPETLRGHYSTLATLFKCSRCNKLLGYLIAEQVPCQPACMRIDRRGNVISNHVKDPSWNLNDYIRWLFGELRSWRRVYWRLWAECHFLKCHLCDTYFPAYQMEWCSYHEQGPQLFCAESRALPAGRYPCCGERAYRFEPLTRNTGCQFREHLPDDRLTSDAAVMDIYNKFRELIAMRPPELLFPERLTRLVPRAPEEEQSGRLQCKEVFWWEGIQLVPPRQPLGLLGKLYTSNNKFNPIARPGSPPIGGSKMSSQSVTVSAIVAPEGGEPTPLPKADSPKTKKKGAHVVAEAVEDDGGEQSSDSSETESDTNEASDASEEDAPLRKNVRKVIVPKSPIGKKRTKVVGRQWIASLSARSNQDGQRRFEERAVRQMRAALARRAAMATTQKPTAPPGGVYAKLEAEWRERHGPKPRVAITARPKPPIKYK